MQGVAAQVRRRPVRAHPRRPRRRRNPAPPTRRRLGGLVRADAYLATDSKWAVVARSRLRYLAAGHEPPNNHTAALAGLVADLGLADHLYLDDDTTTVTARLTAIAAQHYQPYGEITAAVDAAIGDLATAAYRRPTRRQPPPPPPTPVDPGPRIRAARWADKDRRRIDRRRPRPQPARHLADAGPGRSAARC